MRKDIESLEFKYEGERFEGGRMPVIMLGDLHAFRELMIAFAKDEWQLRNPSSKALGKKFDDKVGIDLVSITNKCALLKMETTLETGDGQSMDTSEEEIVQTGIRYSRNLYANGNKGIFPKHLHTHKFEQVKEFGKHLTGDNFIVIGANDNGEPIVVDKVTRDGILKHAKEVQEERIHGLGYLFGAQIDGRVSIQSVDHGIIKIKVPNESGVALGKELSSVVCYDLRAVVSDDRRIKGMPEVLRVDVMTPEQHQTYETALSAVKMAAGATRPSREAALRILHQRPLYADRFMASSNGCEGILFEFVEGGWMWSIETNEDGSCEIYGISMSGPEEVPPISHPNVGDEFIDLIDAKLGG